MSARPDADVATRSCNRDLPEAPMPGGDTGTPVTRARDYKAPVVPIAGYLRGRVARPVLERAAEQPKREAERPGLPRPVFRSPWSEDTPSPRCRIADAREGASAYGGVFWLADAVPLVLNLIVAKPLDLATQRPARFWALTLLVLAFILIRFT